MTLQLKSQEDHQPEDHDALSLDQVVTVLNHAQAFQDPDVYKFKDRVRQITAHDTWSREQVYSLATDMKLDTPHVKRAMDILYPPRTLRALSQPKS